MAIIREKFVIASAKRPGKSPEEFAVFLEQIRDIAAQRSIEVLGYTVTEGPGCWNHGLFIEGNSLALDAFAGSICIALQPGRYSKTDISDKGVSEGQFGFI